MPGVASSLADTAWSPAKANQRQLFWHSDFTSAHRAAALPASSSMAEGNFSLGWSSEAPQAAALATLCKHKS